MNDFINTKKVNKDFAKKQIKIFNNLKDYWKKILNELEEDEKELETQNSEPLTLIIDNNMTVNFLGEELLLLNLDVKLHGERFDISTKILKEVIIKHGGRTFEGHDLTLKVSRCKLKD